MSVLVQFTVHSRYTSDFAASDFQFSMPENVRLQERPSGAYVIQYMCSAVLGRTESDCDTFDKGSNATRDPCVFGACFRKMSHL